MNEEQFETFSTRTLDITNGIIRLLNKESVNTEEALCSILGILADILDRFENPDLIIEKIPNTLKEMLKNRSFS